MTLLLVWRLLHIFFAFGFVGSLVVCDWNSRAARATEDWQQRALLWGIIRRATGGGLGTLLILGVVGFGVYRWWDKIAPLGKSATPSINPRVAGPAPSVRLKKSGSSG
jgi:hypothetical protein